VGRDIKDRLRSTCGEEAKCSKGGDNGETLWKRRRKILNAMVQHERKRLCNVKETQ
jgi:hypothetical protein